MSQPIHILYMIDALCGWAGAETALLRITRHLPPGRYRCTVATFRAVPGFTETAQFPCPVLLFPLRRTYGWAALKSAWQLRRFIRRENVAIVHTFFATSDLWGGLIARLSGCPVLISSRRDMGFQRSRLHTIAYRLLRWMFDEVQAVSEAVRQYCIRQDRLPPDRVVTVHNGVDPQSFAAGDGLATRQALGLERASHIVGVVGNIRRVKGIDVVIRCAAELRRDFPSIVFLIIGAIHEPDYLAELQRLAEALAVTDNIHFLSGIRHVGSVLPVCDVFCLLSHTEGFSNAIVEAMACGLPCVVSRVGGNEEIVRDGENGFVVEPRDPHAAAGKLASLLRDLSRAREMGAAGRELVSATFTVTAMVGIIVQRYDRLMELKRRLTSPARAAAAPCGAAEGAAPPPSADPGCSAAQPADVILK